METKPLDLTEPLLLCLREEWDALSAWTHQISEHKERFFQWTESSELTVWIHSELEALDRLSLLGDAEPLFTARRKRCGRDNLILLSQTERALDALLNAGVQPLALKGLDTLHRFYPRFDCRTLDDVDLLIKREDLGRCLDALEAAGWSHLSEDQRNHYLRSSHHLPIYGPGPIPVLFEIHWNLVQEERYSVDPCGIFERAKSLDVAGREILRMEDTDLVAHLLVHHFAHYFDRRMKWVIDMRYLISKPDFSWEQVATRIYEWGAEVTAGSVLEHLRQWIPEEIPAEATSAMPLGALRKLLLKPFRSSHPLDFVRQTRSRNRQLLIAALLFEKPSKLPTWMWHRLTRGQKEDLSPLD